ncbi:MAG: hypothetical protein WC549_04590 [Actinomycetota bacterium]
MKEKPKDISFHYTNEQMVKDLIAITPISGSVLDTGSGKNKIWFNNLSGEKYECEIEDGCDFYKWDRKIDWIIGNPPFHEGWKFLDKASLISKVGIAFLGNLNFWNSCLPNRFELLKERGFYLNKLHIVQDKRWFGRYYYLIFTKENNNFLTWERKTY